MPPTPKKEAEVKYPNLVVNGVEVEPADLVITVKLVKQLLGLETEADYIKRRQKENPKLKPEQCKFNPDKVFVFDDLTGQKVACWRNNRNRPFDRNTALKYAQVVLNRHWAGPSTFPGETINGETIIISRTGEVESGQHRLIALYLAYQVWLGLGSLDKKGVDQSAHWKTLWPTEPVLESLIVFGVSDDSRIIQTLDNVKPRSLSDVFFTSPLFQKLGRREREACSTILDGAVDFLWKRTGAKTSRERFQTHDTSLAFVDRHPKLKEYTRKVHDIDDNGRPFSDMRLYTTEITGILYLMATSNSNVDDYRNAEPPSQEYLNFDNEEKALEFITELAKGEKGSLAVVEEALARLVDADTGAGGRKGEKHEILAKAWGYFLQGEGIELKDLAIKVQKNSKGMDVPVLDSDFGGIDKGQRREKDDEEEMTEEQMEAEKERVKKERVEELKAKIAERKARMANKNGASSGTKKKEEAAE